MATNGQLKHKLAAIFYADAVGYSRLTGEDEEGTYRRLRTYLDLISKSIQSHNGVVVNYAGDAVLADFPTVSEALTCAAQVQHALKDKNADLPEDRKVQFRIGINLGEVIVDRDEIHGDGVNVAARLEGLAEPGGICISQAVHDALGKKLPLAYEDIGMQQLKNIAEPVHAYSVLLDPSATPARLRRFPRRHVWAGAAFAVLAAGMAIAFWYGPWSPNDGPPSGETVATVPADTPSIAVLPFQNLSDDPNQEYFSDGITNDIITDLSRFSNLFVIASNSVFTYKGKPVNVKDVGRDLVVRI
jgi:adenylate cyclase